MLTQTGGTLGAPVDYSQYTDAKHYRIPEADGARAFYGLMTLTPPDGEDTTLLAFTSCARFSGRFRAARRGHRLQRRRRHRRTRARAGRDVGRSRNDAASGADRARLLAEAGRATRVHHPPLRVARAADRLVLVVLLRPARHRAAGARQPRRDREAFRR